MSAARTATANWAGFMSLLPKIVSDTKRAGSSWRERWFERVRASKSTSLQTTHEPLDRIISPFIPSPLHCTPPPADFANSEVLASPQTLFPSLVYDHRSLLSRRLFCWLCSNRKKKGLDQVSQGTIPRKQLGTRIWSWKIHLCKC